MKIEPKVCYDDAGPAGVQWQGCAMVPLGHHAPLQALSLISQFILNMAFSPILLICAGSKFRKQIQGFQALLVMLSNTKLNM